MHNNNPTTQTTNLTSLLSKHNISLPKAANFCLFQAIADYKKGELKGLNFEQIHMIQLVLNSEGMGNLQRSFNNV